MLRFRVFVDINLCNSSQTSQLHVYWNRFDANILDYELQTKMSTISPGALRPILLTPVFYFLQSSQQPLLYRPYCQEYQHRFPTKKTQQKLERLHSEIPPTAPWLPILVIHIRSQVKTRQSQSYKFKKIAKSSNFEILQETIHATHLLKLLDKMYKYEKDPTRTVDATEWTRDAGRTKWRTDWNQYTPKQLCCVGGIITMNMSQWHLT